MENNNYGMQNQSARDAVENNSTGIDSTSYAGMYAEYFKDDYPDPSQDYPESIQPMYSEPEKPVKSKNSNNKLLVAIIAGVLIILAIALAFVIKGCGGTKEDESGNLFRQGLARVYGNDGKRGFINEDGEEIIAPEYDYAGNFAENGLAVVGLYDENDGWEYGYIDKAGEYAITPRFDYAFDFSDNGLARVYTDDKYGFVNKKGELVIDAQYEYAYDFVDKYAIVVKYGSERKCGFIDKNGDFVIDYEFNAARPFKNGLAAVCDDTEWGFVNEKGKYVIEPQYQLVTDFDDNNLAMVKKDGKWGIINKDGDVVLEPKYDDIYSFADNGLAAVCDNGEWGFIDKKGELAIDCNFDSVTSFSDDGIAAARKNGKWGFIDKKGKWVLEPCYDYVISPCDQYISYVDEYKYEPGGAFVNGKAVVGKDGNAYIVDKKGKEIKITDIDYIENVYCDYIVFGSDSGYGIVNWDGEIVAETDYGFIG